MLSVNPIARVVVNTVRASVSPTAFDTALLLAGSVESIVITVNVQA